MAQKRMYMSLLYNDLRLRSNRESTPYRHTHTHTHWCTYTRTHTYTHAHTQTHIIHARTYKRAHTHTRACAHTHTGAQSGDSLYLTFTFHQNNCHVTRQTRMYKQPIVLAIHGHKYRPINSVLRRHR